jgi:hypothetical protein
MEHANHFPALRLAIIASLITVAAQGCKSGHLETNRGESAQATTSTVKGAEHPLDGGTYCVQTITQGPPVARPIHFSNMVSDSDGSSKDYEADLIGDNFDLKMNVRRPATDLDREASTVPGAPETVIRDGFVESSHTIHYSRGDKSGWAAGPNLFVMAVTPWNLFVAKPDTTSAGTEKINGYDTTRYTVDTTHQSQTEKWAFDTAWRTKDYNITGSAWVTKDTACILKYSIDLERDGNDGKVEKSHYAGGIANP